MSHTRIWEKERADEKDAQLKAKRADMESTKKAVKNIQNKVEKTTLGDLGVLADLKKKMDNEVKEEKTKAKTQTEDVISEKEVVAKRVTSKAKKEKGVEEKKDEEPKTEEPKAEVEVKNDNTEEDSKTKSEDSE